ncbi:MAG TPA: protein tyrosine phosphatase family protein [Novosphingobium sp.]|nr:protein tyrosine phosphatase family protein [Novosphingobium sp.]
MSSDPDDIRGWQRLDANVTTSGRLLTEDVARLKNVGVRHVINLALDDHPEALPDEAGLLAAAGIAYTHIPVPFDAPSEAHFEEFCDAFGGGGPVHVHCIMNYRVSAFLYRYNRDVSGILESAARAQMEQHWSPDTSDHPAAQVWARFIAPRGT